MESVIGPIAGQKGDVFVNPTGIAVKGTAIYNLYNKYDDAGPMRKAFLGKLLTHQFEPGISKRDRTGLELRKSMR